jgi:hypothetical protein
MIHESSPWKAALERDAELIERWAAKPKVSEQRSFLLERKIFLAAYALRKLDEASKLSSTLLSNPIRTQRHLPINEGYGTFNSHHFDRYFDLNSSETIQLPARRLVNVLIHSLVLVELLSVDQTIKGFFVTSDQEAARGLLQFDLPDFTKLMRQASVDFPTLFIRRLDPKTKKWRVEAGYDDGALSGNWPPKPSN